jgi:hypothetical protein
MTGKIHLATDRTARYFCYYILTILYQKRPRLNTKFIQKTREANPDLSGAEAARLRLTVKIAEKFGYNKVTEIKVTKDKNGKEHEVTFE